MRSKNPRVLKSQRKPIVFLKNLDPKEVGKFFGFKVIMDEDK
jgi:hypothetical protein